MTATTPLPGPTERLKVGIFSLTGCAGDQLAILNDTDVLLGLASRVDICSFIMASSHEASCQEVGMLDLAIVEGSVCSEAEVERLKKWREHSKKLMALGTCAVWGGLPAMNAQAVPLAQLKQEVYGDETVFPDAREAKPLSAFVQVDYAVTGCPIEIEEFAEVISALLNGVEPRRPDQSVCSECRMAENRCLVQHQNRVCCGPITVAGCKARCVSYGQACYGCRGPVEDPAYDATVQLFSEHGLDKEQVIQQIRRYTAPAWVENRLTSHYQDPRHMGLGQKPVEESKS
uniref:Putative Hydrogen dehydrogenase delta subunit n=1 Tax=Magnetococcus massalia (strain MO-1) TaxID=451514 RepID=A0A1S7LDN2_MAGMO|nr:putative Hydrogen dehydrogenase delta subunit [Candidatus Magnetococcus massalia]